MRYQAVAELAPYWVGDMPDSVTFDITDENNEVAELPVGTTVEAFLYEPQTITDPLTLAADLDREEGRVTLTWPADTPLETEGGYVIRIKLVVEGHTNFLQTYLIAMAFDGWLSIEQAREWWSDAPTDDALLYMILRNARLAILAWAHKLLPDSPPPPHYVNGQLLQSKAIWTLGQTNPQEEVGFEQLSVRVYPLDWNIKQLVRPRRAIPVAT